jgi:hypothetical protein
MSTLGWRRSSACTAAVLATASLLLAMAGPATATTHRVVHSGRVLYYPRTARPATPLLPLAPAGGVFGSSSVWKTSVRNAPLEANSGSIVADLAKQVSDHYSGNVAFNTGAYSASFYTVPATTKRVDVAFYDCQHKGYTPSNVFTGRGHFLKVPVPQGVLAAPGSDEELSLWSPDSDQLWEFWKFESTDTGYRACWGGRIDHASTDRGIFADGMGATATGLPHAGGMIGIREAQLGRIDHAIELNVVDAATWSKFAWPAQRSDGYDPSGKHLVQEGARFRLDPSLDIASLHLHPIAAMIARAAQEYGFIVNDKGGSVSVISEGGQAAVAAGSADPWRSLLNGSPGYAVMKGFPWSRLQAVVLGYGR